MNVWLNDQQICSNLTLKNLPGTVYHATVNSGSNTFRAEALNQGTVGPNTASIQVSNVIEGTETQQWNLKTGAIAVLEIRY